MTGNGWERPGLVLCGMVFFKWFSTEDRQMTKKATTINGVSNDAADVLSMSRPYLASVDIVGTAPLLFHRWSCDAVEAKAAAAKNSAQKKTDDIESYLYRDDAGYICIPGEYFRQSIIHAAKFRQDPRSPRKSAMDLFKAGVVSMTDLASTTLKDPDFIDRRRVQVQRAGITRSRPALRSGWKVEFLLQVLLPEYIDTQFLNTVIVDAGRLVGIADFRPTFGRYMLTRFDIEQG